MPAWTRNQKGRTPSQELVPALDAIEAQADVEGAAAATLQAALLATGATAAGIVLVGEDVACASGRPAGAPHVRSLEGDGRHLGRLSVWGAAPERLAALDPVVERGAQVIERLRSLAETGPPADEPALDPVTGLFNAVYLEDRLTRELERAERHVRPLCLMVIAPDDGAAEGDEVEGPLGVLSMIVRDRLRSSDVACRLSTNRLGVLLPEAGGMQGVIVADRIRSAARGLPSLEDVESVSIGIAAFPGQAATASELIAAASRALHMARMHGGDRTFLYERAIASELERSLSADRDHDESVLATLIAICADLEEGDGLGLGHCESVGRIAALIARRLGLAADQAEDLRLAGAVHDLGMIGVSREALSKPGPLSPAEWEEVRSHPEVGSRMLAGTPIERLGPWLMHHHERYDGDGYPGGLAGEDIPFEARILAVAEAYDAMTRDRAYAAALDQRSAVQELRRGAGHQFDPAVAEVLIDLVEAGTVRAPYEDGERR